MSAVLVAVVASSGLSEMARGLLRRCGFLVVEARSLDDTRRLIEHGPSPTYVVVMPSDRGGPPPSPDGAWSLTAFLDAVQELLSPDHVIATDARRFHPGDLQRCTAAGVRVLPGGHVSIRRLARFLMQLQGSDGSRCCVSATEQSPARPTARTRSK
jgi:hypothetical protein